MHLLEDTAVVREIGAHNASVCVPRLTTRRPRQLGPHRQNQIVDAIADDQVVVEAYECVDCQRGVS